MPSPQSDALRSLYASWTTAFAQNPNMSLAELRDFFDHWGDVTAEPGGVDYIETDAGGVPALWAIPKKADQARVVQCMHGGGYICASMYTHRKVYGHLAKAIGCRAIIPDYRRAPEHIHPAAVDDTTTCYRWLLDQGITPNHIAFAGDSAGGSLSITTQLRARERGLPLPAAAMSLSPWLDMEAKGASYDLKRDVDAMVKREVALTMAGTFLGEKGDRRDPLANPLYADLKGLPPIYLQMGGDEALLDEARVFTDNARRAGVDITFEVEPQMQHVYHFMAGRAPEADAAIARLANWVRPKLGL